MNERHIIHFKGGIKRTLEGVSYVYENEMTHILLADGREWLINKNNVLAVEIIRGSDHTPETSTNSGGKESLVMSSSDKCPECDGSGEYWGSSLTDEPMRCKTCNGTGVIQDSPVTNLPTGRLEESRFPTTDDKPQGSTNDAKPVEGETDTKEPDTLEQILDFIDRRDRTFTKRQARAKLQSLIERERKQAAIEAYEKVLELPASMLSGEGGKRGQDWVEQIIKCKLELQGKDE